MENKLQILMITHHRRLKSRGRSMIIAEHLVERGHAVTLCVTANTRRFGVTSKQNGDLEIIEFPDLLWGRLRSGWDLWNLLNREYYLDRNKKYFDIVHCFETRPNSIYPALRYSNQHQTPLITDWNDWFGRGGLIEVLRPRWYRTLFGGIETYYEEAFRSKADGLTVISSALADRAIKLGVNPDRICKLRGGSAPEKYPARNKEMCRNRMGYPLDIPIIGFCSSDSYLDIEIVLTTLVILIRKFPTIRLILTGEVKDSVLQLAEKYGVRDHLELPGFVPQEQLSWCLGSSDLFVMPFPQTIYNVGRWPNKLGIYTSQGRPIVTNAVGDVDEVFRKFPIGITADYTAEDFASKIDSLLDDPILSKQLGDNALNFAKTQNNWRTLITDLESFYYRIINLHNEKEPNLT